MQTMIKRSPALVLIAFAACMVFSSCSSSASAIDPSTMNGKANQYVMQSESRELALKAMEEKDRGKSKDYAEKGMEIAERCLMHAPENAGCRYWRAVNTGLYYKIRVVGYQSGIRKMIDDCNAVISLDPKYEHAGAYRMLGQLYTQLPQTGGNVESVTRDLSLAESYLKKAVELAPDYPENYLSLAENYLSQEKFGDAIEALADAKSLVQQWKHDASYEDWKVSFRGLEKQIDKRKD